MPCFGPFPFFVSEHVGIMTVVPDESRYFGSCLFKKKNKKQSKTFLSYFLKKTKKKPADLNKLNAEKL